MTDALKLGATLYIPAIKDNLAAIANGEKYPQLRSMVFCTEDSIYDKDIDKALEKMGKAEENLVDGKPDKAIDHYSKAWDKAQKSL